MLKTTNTVRELPVKLMQIKGESLSSYCDRLAVLYDVPIAEILNRTGMLTANSARFLPGYGVYLTNEQIIKVSRSTGLEPVRVEQMVLSIYGNRIFSWPKVKAAQAIDIRHLATSEWAYFSGSHFCPQCLAEDEGAWKLSWKLPWSFCCVRHKALLIDKCPECQARPASGRRDRSLAPVFIDHVPRSGFCSNPKNYVGNIEIGKAAKPCGCSLLTLRPVDLAEFPRLLNTQLFIDAAIIGESSPFGISASIQPLDLFSDLRSLSALMLYCASPDVLGDIPGSVIPAFIKHAHDRDKIIQERAEFTDGRKGPRQRVFTGPPQSSSVMAAILPLAVSITQSRTASEISQLIKPLVDCMIKRCSNVRWDVLEQFSFSQRLLEAVTSSSASKLKFSRIAGTGSTANLSADKSKYLFEPRHVPQLFDLKTFETEFAALLPQINANNARRFCSMALVKLCGNYTWRDAGNLLMLPSSSYGMANRAVGILQQNRTYEAFAYSLNKYASILASSEQLHDYGLIRSIMSEFKDFQDDDWIGICEQAGDLPFLTAAKRRNSAVWLWAFCTGGDWVLAPALRVGNQGSLREMYRRFSASQLPTLEPHLTAFGVSFCDSILSSGPASFS